MSQRWNFAVINITEMKCHSTKMLQGQNVAVVKHHCRWNVGWTHRQVKMSLGHFVGGWFIKAPIQSQNSTYMWLNIFDTEKKHHRTYCPQKLCNKKSYIFYLFCSVFPVLPDKFCLSCSDCPVLSFLYCLSRSVFLVCLSHSIFPVLPVTFCLSFPACPVLFWQSRSARPFLPVLFYLSFSACPLLTVLCCLSSSVYFVLPVIFFPYCSACPVMPVMS